MSDTSFSDLNHAWADAFRRAFGPNSPAGAAAGAVSSSGLNPFSQSAVDLNQYVQAARPQIARMLGMQPPQARVNQGFNDLVTSNNPPPMDFNQSFGGTPFNNPGDKAAFLSKYLMPLSAQKSMEDNATKTVPLTPPAPREGSSDVWQGPSQFAGGPQNTSGGVTPQPNAPGFSDDFMGRFAKMGSESGAGLIPKFAYLAGLGRTV